MTEGRRKFIKTYGASARARVCNRQLRRINARDDDAPYVEQHEEKIQQSAFLRDRDAMSASACSARAATKAERQDRRNPTPASTLARPIFVAPSRDFSTLYDRAIARNVRERAMHTTWQSSSGARAR
jgi:hypothetical protein